MTCDEVKIVHNANSKVSSEFHFISLTSHSPSELHLLHLENISRDCKMTLKRNKGNIKFKSKILISCMVFLLGGEISIGRAEGEITILAAYFSWVYRPVYITAYALARKCEMYAFSFLRNFVLLGEQPL